MNRATRWAFDLKFSTMETPSGIKFELRPGRFLLRASCGSLVNGMFPLFFAGLLGAIPFILWADLMRGLPSDEGLSFWLTAAFLCAWASADIYVAGMAAYGFFGEIRILKTDDRGEIFKGIGGLGRTRHLLWSDFQNAEDMEVAEVSSTRFNRTVQCIGLNGASKRYRFGAELTTEQRAFVVAFLREHALRR